MTFHSEVFRVVTCDQSDYSRRIADTRLSPKSWETLGPERALTALTDIICRLHAGVLSSTSTFRELSAVLKCAVTAGFCPCCVLTFGDKHGDFMVV